MTKPDFKCIALTYGWSVSYYDYWNANGTASCKIFYSCTKNTSVLQKAQFYPV